MVAIEQLSTIIRAGIDTHVHVGDSNRLDGGLPRMWTAKETNELGMPVVGKAHFLQFVPESEYVFGSMTLNTGFSPERVQIIAREMSRTFVIWFPSLNARAHHEAVAQDAAWEKLFMGVDLGDPIGVIDETGNLTTPARETIDAIREARAILATGHLSSDEVRVLVPEAIRQGVKSIVLTHVSSRHNRLSTETQVRLILDGKKRGVPVYAEHCAITWYDGKVGAYDLVRDFIAPIQAVGAGNCIVSSDCGRIVGPGKNVPTTPLDCLGRFADLLIKGGLTETEMREMLVENPRRLLL